MIRPFDVLTRCLGKTVLIKTKDNKLYEGELRNYDVNMNVTLTGATEIEDGNPAKRYGTLIIRGSTIVCLGTRKPEAQFQVG
jgi:small nuclear ribonucleoprotein (snRNP)-like protein